MANVFKNYHDTTCRDVEKKQSMTIVYKICHDAYTNMCQHALTISAHNGNFKIFCSLKKDENHNFI